MFLLLVGLRIAFRNTHGDDITLSSDDEVEYLFVVHGTMGDHLVLECTANNFRKVSMARKCVCVWGVASCVRCCVT